MTLQSPPYALQNAAHNAALFRQAGTAVLVAGGGIAGPTELAVTAGTGLTVRVAAGRIWVPGTAVANIGALGFNTQGFYFALNDAQVTLNLATSDPTNPRIDVVYAAINDSFYSGAADTAVLGVSTGTPAASPVAPAIPTNALALATVNVPANSTTVAAGNITDSRTRAWLQGATAVVPGAIATPSLAGYLPDGTPVWDPSAAAAMGGSGVLGVKVGGSIIAMNPPAAELAMVRSSNQNVATASWTALALSAVEYQTGTGLTNNAAGVIINATGRYLCEAQYSIAGNPTGRRSVGFGPTTGTSPYSYSPTLWVGGSQALSLSHTQTMTFYNGDIIAPWAYQDSGIILLASDRRISVRRVG